MSGHISQPEAIVIERDALIQLDRSIGQARYGAYILMEVDATLGEQLEVRLREIGELVTRQLQRIERRKR